MTSVTQYLWHQSQYYLWHQSLNCNSIRFTSQSMSFVILYYFCIAFNFWCHTFVFGLVSCFVLWLMSHIFIILAVFVLWLMSHFCIAFDFWCFVTDVTHLYLVWSVACSVTNVTLLDCIRFLMFCDWCHTFVFGLVSCFVLWLMSHHCNRYKISSSAVFSTCVIHTYTSNLSLHTSNKCRAFSLFLSVCACAVKYA